VSNPNKWLYAAAKLFHEIWTDLGEANARRIFRLISGPRTPRQEAEFRNQELLDYYDTMMPKPNIQKLAGQLVEANKTLPVECRYGPRGTTDPLIMDKHIRRLVARRRKLRGY
jgi:ABC-type antimicrobial peptide transport system ATPase subunit